MAQELAGEWGSAAWVPCARSMLRKGNVAVLRGTDGKLFPEVVVEQEPLRTRLFSQEKSLRGQVVGRLEEVRRGPLRLRVSSQWVRRLVFFLHAFLAAVRANPLRRKVTQFLRLLATGPLTAWARRALLFPVQIRPLLPADAQALRTFTDKHLPEQSAFLEKQVKTRWAFHGAAVGAFGRSGRLLGMVVVDEYRQEGVDIDGYWVRGLAVEPIARCLGLASGLCAGVKRLALSRGIRRARADFSVTNEAVTRLLPTFGLRPSPPAYVQAFNARCFELGLGCGWAVWEFRDS